MIVGYAVEGSTDRAFINGLRSRWCPGIVLIEGAFRGSTGLSLRREYGKICEEFAFKGAVAALFLTDSNDQAWRDVQKNERDHFPVERLSQAIHGVCERNIESWICADKNWIAKELGTEAKVFKVDDPKGTFEGLLNITRDDKKETEIAEIVQRAPLRNWLSVPSFKDFYEQVRDMSQVTGCTIENLLEK